MLLTINQTLLFFQGHLFFFNTPKDPQISLQFQICSEILPVKLLKAKSLRNVYTWSQLKEKSGPAFGLFLVNVVLGINIRLQESPRFFVLVLSSFNWRQKSFCCGGLLSYVEDKRRGFGNCQRGKTTPILK